MQKAETRKTERETQTQLLKIKTTLSEMGNTADRINSRLDIAKKKKD